MTMKKFLAHLQKHNKLPTAGTQFIVKHDLQVKSMVDYELTQPEASANLPAFDTEGHILGQQCSTHYTCCGLRYTAMHMYHPSSVRHELHVCTAVTCSVRAAPYKLQHESFVCLLGNSAPV